MTREIAIKNRRAASPGRGMARPPPPSGGQPGYQIRKYPDSGINRHTGTGTGTGTGVTAKNSFTAKTFSAG
jgi:hypothetical protein